MKPTVSIVVPVYNEVGRLIDGFSQIVRYLEKVSYSWELILVDDGSSLSPEMTLLGTRMKNKVLKLKKQQKLFFVQLSSNKGKGKAIQAGVIAANGKEIIFTDIDCSVPMTFIPHVRNVLRKSDVAIASRRTSGSVIVVHQSQTREAAGRMYTFIANTICGLSVSDLTCGFKGFRAQAAKRIFFTTYIDRWSFDTELLFLVKKFRYRLQEVPVDWSNKTGSRVKILDTVRSFIDLFRIRLYDAVGMYK